MTSSLDPTGVGDHIKGRKGMHGNTGEPPASTRKAVTRVNRAKKIRASQVHIVTCGCDKKKAISQWYRSRGKTEAERRAEAVLASP